MGVERAIQVLDERPRLLEAVVLVLALTSLRPVARVLSSFTVPCVAVLGGSVAAALSVARVAVLASLSAFSAQHRSHFVVLGVLKDSLVHRVIHPSEVADDHFVIQTSLVLGHGARLARED